MAAARTTVCADDVVARLGKLQERVERDRAESDRKLDELGEKLEKERKQRASALKAMGEKWTKAQEEQAKRNEKAEEEAARAAARLKSIEGLLTSLLDTVRGEGLGSGRRASTVSTGTSGTPRAPVTKKQKPEGKKASPGKERPKSAEDERRPARKESKANKRVEKDA